MYLNKLFLGIIALICALICGGVIANNWNQYNDWLNLDSLQNARNAYIYFNNSNHIIERNSSSSNTFLESLFTNPPNANNTWLGGDLAFSVGELFGFSAFFFDDTNIGNSTNNNHAVAGNTHSSYIGVLTFDDILIDELFVLPPLNVSCPAIMPANQIHVKHGDCHYDNKSFSFACDNEMYYWMSAGINHNISGFVLLAMDMVCDDNNSEKQVGSDIVISPGGITSCGIEFQDYLHTVECGVFNVTSQVHLALQQYDNHLTWNTAILQDGNYVYIYGTNKDYRGYYLVLSRVNAQALFNATNTQQLESVVNNREYLVGIDYHDHPVWSHDSFNGDHLYHLMDLDENLSGTTVAWNSYMNTWFFVFVDSDDAVVKAVTSENLWGPWRVSPIYYIPEPYNDVHYYKAFNGQLHSQFNTNNDQTIIFSYNVVMKEHWFNHFDDHSESYYNDGCDTCRDHDDRLNYGNSFYVFVNLNLPQ